MGMECKIENSNVNTFSPCKMRVLVVLRMIDHRCIAKNGQKPLEITNKGKWKEMDVNVISNLQQAQANDAYCQMWC